MRDVRVKFVIVRDTSGCCSFSCSILSCSSGIAPSNCGLGASGRGLSAGRGFSEVSGLCGMAIGRVSV